MIYTKGRRTPKRKDWSGRGVERMNEMETFDDKENQKTFSLPRKTKKRKKSKCD